MFSRANSHNLLQNTSVREWLMSIVNQHISELELLLSSLFPIYTRKLLLFLQTRFLLTSLASTSNTSQSARLFHEGYLELNHSPHLSNLCLKGVISKQDFHTSYLPNFLGNESVRSFPPCTWPNNYQLWYYNDNKVVCSYSQQQTLFSLFSIKENILLI